MRVIAYPNRHFPPSPDALALADVVLESMSDVPAALGAAERR
jgi:hypothetical protein